MRKQDQPRLTVELVPRTSWGKNVRKIVSQDTWKALRISKLRESRSCAICASERFEDELHLHEVWDYDDSTKTQTLTSLILLCRFCHDAKHLGRAIKVGDGEEAMAHFCQVNGWPSDKAKSYFLSQLNTWRERSEHEWELDVSYLHDFLGPRQIHLSWLDRSFSYPSNPVEAREWAQEILKSDAVILDTETTGLLNRERSEIVQISIVSMSGEALLEETIKPKYKIPKAATKIHGLTNEMVKNCSSFPDVFDSTNSLLHGRAVIAYKAAFDSGILERTCYLYGLSMPECQWHCAMWAYHIYRGQGGKFPRLPNAKHSATEDCRAVLELLQKMAAGVGGSYYGLIN